VNHKIAKELLIVEEWAFLEAMSFSFAESAERSLSWIVGVGHTQHE
jgi:hypothetical protein